MPFLWIILMLSRFSHFESMFAQADSLCRFEADRAMCDNLNLSYIPPIPSYIQELHFMNNELEAISMETFKNISKPGEMTQLILASNKISNISSDAFDSFTNVRLLNLSHNKVGTTDLKFLLPELADNLKLERLVLIMVGRSPITDEVFSSLKSSPSSQLILNSNNIAQLSTSSLQRLYNISSLHLDRNRLMEINFPKMESLEGLTINHNQLLHIPTFCSGPTSLTPRLKVLFLNYNLIDSVDGDTFKCLPNLRNVQLGFNRITVLKDDLFFYASKLSSLKVSSGSSGSRPIIHKHAFRSKTLKHIEIGFNGDALTIFESLSDTFQGLPSLQKLKILFIHMQSLTKEQQSQLFSPLTNLTKFWCYDCRLSGNVYTILQHKPYLQYINLKMNLIENLTLDAEMRNLRTVSVANNKIKHVYQELMPRNMLDRLETFDISDNPFVCDCSFVWFIDWLKSTNHSKLKHFPNGYKCADPPELTGKLVTDVHLSYFDCHPFTTAELIGIIGGPILVVIMVLSAVGYRNRWNIKHYIYLIRRRQKYANIQDKNYEYGAFVAYSAESYEWVRFFLLPLLEGEFNLNTCVHDRDFRPGAFINDNIVECMNKSKRIILVLSNAFANSGWCMFELKVANSLHIEEDVEVIVVVLENILARNMNISLKLLLETTTYLEWTDQNEEGHELFLTRIKDVLGS